MECISAYCIAYGGSLRFKNNQHTSLIPIFLGAKNLDGFFLKKLLHLNSSWYRGLHFMRISEKCLARDDLQWIMRLTGRAPWP